MCRFLEARLEEADARRSSFEKQARQIAQSTKELRRSTSSDIQRCGSYNLTIHFLVYPIPVVPEDGSNTYSYLWVPWPNTMSGSNLQVPGLLYVGPCTQAGT